jgi:hypothetical protein
LAPENSGLFNHPESITSPEKTLIPLIDSAGKNQQTGLGGRKPGIFQNSNLNHKHLCSRMLKKKNGVNRKPLEGRQDKRIYLDVTYGILTG